MREARPLSTTFPDLRAEVRRIASWLVQVVSTCSADGDPQFLIDSKQWIDTNQDSITSDAPRGTWILRPTCALSSDRERRAGGTTTVDVTLGHLFQAGGVWTNAPVQDETYELWGIQPSVAFALLQETMENLPQGSYSIIPGFTDADMSASGVTNWTLSHSGIFTKDTTISHSGGQSGLLQANGVATYEYAESPNIVVPRGLSARLSVIAGNVTGTATYIIWDKSNGAEIDASGRLTWSGKAFVSMPRTVQIPATCDEISVRLAVAGLSDRASFDCVSGPSFSGQTLINLPSHVTRESNVRKLYAADYRQAAGNGAYVADSRRYEEQPHLRYYTRIDSHHVHSARLEAAHGQSFPNEELWIETVQPASTITAFANDASGEAAPVTNLGKRFVALEWTRRMCEYVLSYIPDDPEATMTKAALENPRGELARLWRDHENSLETPSFEPTSPLVSSPHVI